MPETYSWASRAPLLSIIFASFVAACSGGGGGKTNVCAFAAQQSPGWADQVLATYTPTILQRCPLTLAALTTVNPFVRVDMDAGKNAGFPPSIGLYEMWIKNTADGSGNPVAPFKQSWDYLIFTSDAPSYSQATGPVYRAQTFFEYTLGYPAQAGLRERDSLFMYYQLAGGVTYTSSSFVAVDKAGFWARNDVVKDTLPADMLGPSQADAGIVNSWRAYTTWDTTGYEFDWYVNGVLQQTDTTATLAKSFSLAGDYLVRFDQHLLDTTYTVTKNVHVPITVVTTAPDTLNLTEVGYWTATASAGTPPYTYSWSVDGNVVGTGSTLAWSSEMGGTVRYVTLHIADSNSQSRTLWFNVWITDGLPCGGDPSCAAELRAPSSGSLLNRARRRPR